MTRRALEEREERQGMEQCGPWGGLGLDPLEAYSHLSSLYPVGSDEAMFRTECLLVTGIV